MQSFNITKLADYQIAVSVIMAAAAWKFGDYKNWRIYYPTMLYFITGDFLYSLLTYKHPLWAFESPLLNTTFSDLLICFVFFPSTLLIFLPHFPKGLKKQVPYVLLWVFSYTFIEFISFKLGYFSYHNGWSIWWSLLFNCIMFPMLRLHHSKPLAAWPISFMIAAAFLIYFKVPISNLK